MEGYKSIPILKNILYLKNIKKEIVMTDNEYDQLINSTDLEKLKKVVDQIYESRKPPVVDGKIILFNRSVFWWKRTMVNRTLWTFIKKEKWCKKSSNYSFSSIRFIIHTKFNQ